MNILKEVKIFISYSHEDSGLFKTFKTGIETHSKNSKQIKWNLWSDVEIPTGKFWHETIQEKITESNAAILLVSANSFSSDYIKNQEFQQFVEKNKQGGFTFFPVLLSDCDYSQWEELVKIQFFNPQGQDYEVEKFRNKIIPYDYVNQQHLKNTYHKNCVSAFENALSEQQKTNATKSTIVNSNQKTNENLLQTYKKGIADKYSKVTLLEKDVAIKDVYVDLLYEDFRFTTTKEPPKSCEELICKEETESERKNFINMVILGLPGAGKSTLLKYLLYKYNQNNNIIPIYVELKNDNDFTTHIIEHSNQVRMTNIRDYLERYFEHILTGEGEAKTFLNGNQDKEFIFFCDGLDEISPDNYDKFHKAINHIISFNNHRAIISSREIGFSANDYPKFKLYSLMDFDTNKQIEYIDKYFKTVDTRGANRKSTLIDLIKENTTISQLSKSPILLSLLCITDDIENIRNKAQLFKNAIKILLKNRQITEDVSQERLVNFLKEIAVVFFKLDKAESFEKNELSFYANKFFCQTQDEICGILKGRYLECGLFVSQSKDKTYKFTHRTIWEYLVAAGMVERERNEIYSRANMGLWEESIKMYVTLIDDKDLQDVLSGIWKKNKALALSCMQELEVFPETIFSTLYGNLEKRDKLMLIATLRESYTNPSSEYRKQIVNVIKDTLLLIHKAESEAKDCEVIYAYIEFLEEFKGESVFNELLTQFLNLNNAPLRRQKLCNNFGLSFVDIPSGSFEMGRNLIQETETNADGKKLLNIDLEETPAHQVKISHKFQISQTLITNAMYYNSGFPYADKERLNNNPWSNQDTQPVNKVNWYEAIVFAKWLGCTLPTEAEWEYAFVGATEDKNKFTKSYREDMITILDDNEFACYSKNSNNTTRPVLPIDKAKTNSLGLLDMLGNLREWCMDWYSDDFYIRCSVDNFGNFLNDIIGKEEISYKLDGTLLKEDEAYNGDIFTFDKDKNCINPVKRKPGKFEAKCLRGGCYDWNESNLRPTYRNHNPANNVYKVNGFRLVLKDDNSITN